MAAPLLPVADARRLIVSSLKPLDMETVKLADALGRALAEPPVARVSHPPADVSAMDGYAVRAEDLSTVPATLRVIGESAAGHPSPETVGPGTAVRIFTGAVVPKGANTVVIQENAEALADNVSVKEQTLHGKNIRPAGQDFKAGETILIAPRRLSARDIGLLAAMNVPEIRAYRRPRVGVLSTGDEIVLPGETPGSGQIFSANGPGLCAFVQSAGGEPVHLGVVPDDASALLETVSNAKDLDMIVTSGGVSVGDHDLIKQSLVSEGLNVSFHKIAMRPGKPLLFGDFMGLPFMGLPGNPVSAMVCALLFLGPAIDVLSGLPGDAPKTVPAILDTPLAENDGREDYIRALSSSHDGGHLHVSALPRQDSAMVAALAKSDALIVRPPNAPAAAAGQHVPIICL